MRGVSMLAALVAGLIFCPPALAQEAKMPMESTAEPPDVLATLDRGHPRLMLKDEDLARLKQLHSTDPVLRRYVAHVLRQADACCDKRPLTYDKRGPRLLHVSRECLRRVYALGLAWRWTGEARYADKVIENLLAVCDFPDWNPSHFLDTAEMSHAVGVGYDWLYGYLDAGTRERIKAGLIRHGLEAGLEAYGEPHWFVRCTHNWNQVCNGGLIVGALAVAESDPRYAETIIPAAVASLPRALASYAPDGAWKEGPGYWHYATSYTAYGLAALDSALGTDFGLSGSEGLSQTGLFPIYSTGPTGRPLNFADCGGNARRRPMPCMFWLAGTFGDALIADDEHAALAGHDASPGHVIWYVPPPAGPVPQKDLDRLFRGPVPVALMRSAWDDPDALFVGVKAGYNQVNHGHLDLGSFELDALGVRWASDLGSDDYNMPGYWDGREGGRRWSYYRLNSHSHNVPLVNSKGQLATAAAEVERFASGDEAAFTVIDLTGAYRGRAESAMRGVALVAGRRAVLVQDELRIQQPSEVAWGMTTYADVTPAENGAARLTMDGRDLIARVLSPLGTGFAVESAEQEPPQNLNEGARRLVVRIKPASGSVRVAVLLSPVWKDTGPVRTVDLRPLAQW